jgi:hypothetical protein
LATVPYGRRGRFQPGLLVKVAQDELVDNIDFELPLGGVVVGQILDEHEEPIVGAVVSVEELAGDQAWQDPTVPQGLFELGSNMARTDDRGMFRVFGLSSGRYLVSALASGIPRVGVAGGAPRRHVRTYFPGVVFREQAQMVEIRAGGETSVDWQIRAARLCLITGAVVSSNGRSLDRGYVRLARTRGHGGLMLGSAEGVARVGPKGDFTLAALPEQSYVLVATTGSPWSGGGHQRDVEYGTKTVVVGTTDVSGVRLTTRRGASVSGRVNGPGFELKRGLPAPRVFPIPLLVNGAPLASAPIELDGSFDLRNVFGPCLLSFDGGVRREFQVMSISRDGADITNTGLDGTPGAEIDGVVLRLEPRTRLSGIIVADSRGSCSNVIVLAYPEDEARWNDPAGLSVRVTYPEKSGRFTFVGLPPRPYRVVAIEESDFQSNAMRDALRDLLPNTERVVVGRDDVFVRLRLVSFRRR